jgi:hypothetical protein
VSKYQQFVFKRYTFDAKTGELRLLYGYDDVLEFEEVYRFKFPFAKYDKAALERALQLLFFMAGVSYYKMYLAPEIKVYTGQIDAHLASFLSKTYQRGLGEFWYVNKLDPRTRVTFPATSQSLDALAIPSNDGFLIGLGGGKDSLVSIELLRDQPKVATWSLNHQSQLEPLKERVGLPHLWVERKWDPQISELNHKDALNGHVPISAIFSCVGLVVSILSGYKDGVVSNESSASEPSLTYEGQEINHQYSKSLEYEQDFQTCLQHLFGESVRYYSLLRPFTEVRIAELFANIGFQKYKDVFSSCNKAYRHGQNHMFWCGECAKCAFVFLILTPFITRHELEALWHGKNLLLDPQLEQTYKQLLGIDGDKPLDCVGEVKEARAAMQLATEFYPELTKYELYLPEDYDFRAWNKSRIPDEVLAVLKQKIT